MPNAIENDATIQPSAVIGHARQARTDPADFERKFDSDLRALLHQLRHRKQQLVVVLDEIERLFPVAETSPGHESYDRFLEYGRRGSRKARREPVGIVASAMGPPFLHPITPLDIVGYRLLASRPASGALVVDRCRGIEVEKRAAGHAADGLRVPVMSPSARAEGSSIAECRDGTAARCQIEEGRAVLLTAATAVTCRPQLPSDTPS